MNNFEDLSEDDIADIVLYLQSHPNDSKSVEYLMNKYDCSSTVIYDLKLYDGYRAIRRGVEQPRVESPGSLITLPSYCRSVGITGVGGGPVGDPVGGVDSVIKEGRLVQTSHLYDLQTIVGHRICCYREQKPEDQNTADEESKVSDKIVSAHDSMIPVPKRKIHLNAMEDPGGSNAG